MRVIALDLGEKSLGICISDPNRIIPIPLENYQFKNFDFRSAVKKLIYYLEKFNDVNLVLIGYPKKTSGEYVQATSYVDQFLAEFDKLSNQKIEIKKIDERFSTKRGIELLKSKYKNQQELNKNKDLAAAYIMLYDFLLK